jgi:hypothetical protein
MPLLWLRQRRLHWNLLKLLVLAAIVSSTSLHYRSSYHKILLSPTLFVSFLFSRPMSPSLIFLSYDTSTRATWSTRYAFLPSNLISLWFSVKSIVWLTIPSKRLNTLQGIFCLSIVEIVIRTSRTLSASSTTHHLNTFDLVSIEKDSSVSINLR